MANPPGVWDMPNEFPAGIETVNRMWASAAEMWAAWEAKHPQPAYLHDDPLVPRAVAYVSVDSVTGSPRLRFASNVRDVTRLSKGRFQLLFRGLSGINRNMVVEVAPVGTPCMPVVIPSDASVPVFEFHRHLARFEAYNSVTQTTVSEGSDVQLDIDSEDVDKGGYFDTSSSQFDVPATGRYKFEASVFASDDGISGPDVSGTLKIKRNTDTVWSEALASGNPSGTVSVENVILSAEEGDTFTLYFNGTATSGNLDIKCLQFDGMLVGADERADLVDTDFVVVVRGAKD